LSQFKNFRTKFNDLLHNESNRDTVPDNCCMTIIWQFSDTPGPVAKLHTSFAHANLINSITHSHKSWNNTPSSSYNNPVY